MAPPGRAAQPPRDTFISLLSLGLSPLPLVHPHFVNASASSEGSGESAHCVGSAEPSSFVNLVKLYQIFMQGPIKCCMKLFRHERDNISGKQIEYAILMLVIWAENAFHVVGFNFFNTIYRGHLA